MAKINTCDANMALIGETMACSRTSPLEMLLIFVSAGSYSYSDKQISDGITSSRYSPYLALVQM